MRFPREADDDLLAERARLEAVACRQFCQYDKARLELGRTFIHIKATFKHGQWTRAYYAKTFGMFGVSFRTVQRWMQKARRADADAKNDGMSFLNPATDEGALKVNAATAKAEAELAGATRRKPTRENLLRLPAIPMKDDERDACERLVKGHWPRTENEIIALLKRLCVEFHIANSVHSRKES